MSGPRATSSDQVSRPISIGRERLRNILHRNGITFHRTKTWKESNDPDRDTKVARIEYVNEPVSAANANDAGANPPYEQPDRQTPQTFVVTALVWRHDVGAGETAQ
ncbi:hypothetical protein Asi03nite_58850 [Actinoplanes siamensis]|uniref:Transposase n=1 Tax=Actinoplanes siamensis TaxID=1223317 RepID=A0A919TN43_9ACTN|nr:hypothetical protein Asi03nite_58850 [Actinoplanes siamensis]